MRDQLDLRIGVRFDRRAAYFAGFWGAIGSLWAAAAPAQNATLPSRTETTLAYTSNWAGYAALPGTAVTSVQGNWTVPTIDSSVTPNGYASIWVGMDGYPGGDNLEQCGITAYCATPGGRHRLAAVLRLVLNVSGRTELLRFDGQCGRPDSCGGQTIRGRQLLLVG